MATKLYHSIFEYWQKKDPSKLELEHQVWDPTPWIIDVYVGERNSIGIGEDEYNILLWCRQNIGEQSWPIHDKPKNTWYRAGATVDGWTWIGFGTEEQMQKFQKAWPGNLKLKEGILTLEE